MPTSCVRYVYVYVYVGVIRNMLGAFQKNKEMKRNEIDSLS